MTMKITAEMQCIACGRKIEAKGRPFRGRRSSGVMFKDLFVFEGPDTYYDNKMHITKGYVYHNGDDAEDVLCSERCVIAEVTKHLPKMKMPKGVDD